MSAMNTLKKFGLEQAFNYVYKDPDKNFIKIMDWADKFSGGGFPTQRAMIRAAISNPEHPYYPFIHRLVTDIDPHVMKTLVANFFINANLAGWKKQDECREKYGCNIPWAILLDPTSACNLHCTGCWAAEYGNKLNLTYDEIDDIIRQGKELGVYMYIYTGGEPLVRKKDLIRLCEKHNDCIFLSFTNATLIDEDFANDMLRVGNFVPAISLEGFETATDGRRGNGVYQKVIKAINLLREKKLVFGISACYTSANFESITSEAFYDSLIDLGAYFIWYFHYMPVGNDAAPELLPTPAQRRETYERIRKYRATKPLFAMDFQNDAEFVGGCIAGGRRYLHINANVPAISLEGFETATDGRRGNGVYQKVIKAINLLREKKLVFGISACYTSANFESITSEAFYDSLIDLGAYFIWYFHYMPVGNDAAPELLPTPAQRRETYERIRKYRATKPLFAMDFQNDAEFVGGCIAGGRRYLHINANGDIDPCVFIHYSDSNIREKTLLEALQSPMMMAYHDGQPFNDNMYRPCPMLENPQKLREMVEKSGAHSTDLQSPESAEHLCAKCDRYAENWKPVAEEMWKEDQERKAAKKVC